MLLWVKKSRGWQKFKIEVSPFGGGWIKSGSSLVVSTTLVIFYFLTWGLSFLDRFTETIPEGCFCLGLIISWSLLTLFAPHRTTYGLCDCTHVPRPKGDAFAPQSRPAGFRGIDLLSWHPRFQKYWLAIVLIVEKLIILHIVYYVRNSLAPMPETNASGTGTLTHCLREELTSITIIP